MSISDTLRSIFNRKDADCPADCPNEAEVLGYFESRLSMRKRAHLERHFAGCDDCRELLAVLGSRSDETQAPLALEAVLEQTNRVLSLIRSDELTSRRPEHKPRWFPVFDVSNPSLAAAALIICTIAITATVLLSGGQKPAEAAMQAIALAVKDGRHTEARVSGGLVHSRYSDTRGAEDADNDLQFGRAISKMEFVEHGRASVDDQLVLARIYLARGTPQDAGHALSILEKVATPGGEKAEVLNDTGVAKFEMRKYEDAINDFTRALEKSPNYNEAIFNRALAYERAHQNDQAKQDWERYIQQSSDDGWKAEARERLKDLGGKPQQ